MNLPPGTRIGPYEVISALGVGGMGEVYRARDAKLNRDVAIKVLLPSVVADPDRIARFRREAQVLASLNHPNIAHIHGIEEADGVTALVLELVEGEDLAQRLARGPIAIDEALPIAVQIAEALEAAHDLGIIHRDLKPANIKLRPDGTVKVLDFGLAKAVDPSGSTSAEAMNSPTLSMHATQTGVVLGTAAYMSPEQARGKAVDRRADIWAFGVVLYEMLTGQRPFKGDDVTDILASVLKDAPAFDALPASTPPRLRWVLERCLRRDPRARLRDIGEARVVLTETAAHDPSLAAATTPSPSVWQRYMPFATAGLLLLAIVGISAAYINRSPVPTKPVTKFTVGLLPGQIFPTGGARGTNGHMLALSPDGKQIVYGAAPAGLYLRQLADLTISAINGTQTFGNVTEAAFSPDGQSIAFYSVADQTLKRISVAGGTAVTIVSVESPYGLAWGPDGLVFGQKGRGILRVAASSGATEVIVPIAAGEIAHAPQVLPGGRHVLFTLVADSGVPAWDDGRIIVQSIASGERVIVVTGGSDARYLPTGHIVYAVSGGLRAIAFDLARLAVRGGPTPVVEGIRRTGGQSNAANFTVSDTGTLAYVSGPAFALLSQYDLAVADRQGRVEALRLPPRAYSSPRVAPDGKRVTFFIDDGKQSNVYIYALSGTSAMQRLTFDGNSRYPLWSSDGTRIAYQSDRDGDLAIFSQPVDGGRQATRLTKAAPGESHIPETWSSPLARLLYRATKGNDVVLWVLSLDDNAATPFGGVRSLAPTNATFSPDGRWVAYSITDGDRTSLYVQPFPATGAPHQFFAKALDGPHEPVWSPDGKELFFNPRAGGFEAVRVVTQPTFQFGNSVPLPRPLLLSPPAAHRSYDITPDGKFIGLVPAGFAEAGTSLAPQIHVVLNWFEELKQRVPVQ